MISILFKKFLNKIASLKEERSYRAYTKIFDREISADLIGTVLGPLSETGDCPLEHLKIRLETDLMSWSAGLHVLAADTSEAISQKLSRQEIDDISLTILIDQSGSMRGQKMTYTFATMEIIQDLCENMRLSYEILGFTTLAWRGGRSRELWKSGFPSPGPGRLNDLLHIIYKDAMSPGRARLTPMLRPDLLKENVDGEAIIWAAERLMALPQSRKLLIVLSDGAPVDDSTLLENDPDYLMDHLRKVISDISQSNDIEIAAIGLDHRVDTIYPTSIHVQNPKDLGSSVIALISQMMTRDKPVIH